MLLFVPNENPLMQHTVPSSGRNTLHSLRLQLSAALGLLTILLIVVSAATINGMRTIEGQLQQEVRGQIELSRAASSVATATLMCRRYEKDLFLNIDNPVIRSDYWAKWDNASTELQAAIARFDSVALSDEDQAQLRQWQQESAMYAAAMRDLFQQVEAGRIVTAAEANTALTPHKDTIRNLTDSALATAVRSDTQLQASMAALDASISNILGVALLVSGLGIALAILWALLFPPRFLRPLVLLRTAAEQIAGGDLTARVALQRKDEIGELAASFNQMAATIQRQVAELDQRELIEKQNEELRALIDLVQVLETPVIELHHGVLLTPLVGVIDSERADRILTNVLDVISRERINTVIVDITGIALLDTASAQHLERLATAVHLMGAQIILTGVRASIAQSIVSLNLSLTHYRTFGQLREGINVALRSRLN